MEIFLVIFSPLAVAIGTCLTAYGKTHVEKAMQKLGRPTSQPEQLSIKIGVTLIALGIAALLFLAMGPDRFFN